MVSRLVSLFINVINGHVVLIGIIGIIGINYYAVTTKTSIDTLLVDRVWQIKLIYEN